MIYYKVFFHSKKILKNAKKKHITFLITICFVILSFQKFHHRNFKNFKNFLNYEISKISVMKFHLEISEIMEFHHFSVMKFQFSVMKFHHRNLSENFSDEITVQNRRSFEAR